ncbi:HlyD family type I secretion periplasmic adaptor subunit [Roseococcus sp.]|uniref:HlyD family type I secretion periplasmic adaptor subunit n=1 Tax=Roseococcus sp. TaxID=2109646 RepID=UPI003BAA356E
MSARQDIARRPIAPALDPLGQDRPRTGWLIAAGLFVTIGLFGGFMAWAVFAPLAEAAIAPGVIKVEGTRRTLSHLEGGIIREILVRDGSAVAAGDVVMRLDDVQSGATLEGLRAQRFALQAQGARLEAEATGAAGITFPRDLAASGNERAQEAMAGQRTLFEARNASLASQLLVLESRVTQQQAAIAGAEGQIEATRRQLELMRQEEAMRSGLVRQGLARVPELLALQRALAALEGQMQDLTSQVRRAEGAIAEARGGIAQTRDQRLQEIGTEARDVAARLADTEERLRAAADVSARREITAPEAGTILNLRQFTAGAVLRAGDPAMDLVPAQDRLVAEVNIQPNDIDVVHVGLPAELRLPAFRQRLIPVLHGVVTFVAADVTSDPQTRANFFRAQIRVDDAQLAALPSITLVAGMPVEGHVQIGQRSFWRYLTQPIRDSLARAFQEQ